MINMDKVPNDSFKEESCVMTFEEVQNFIKAGHFFLIPDDILDYDLSPTAFMIFFYLCHCSDAMGSSFPSRETIGKRCGGISVVTVDKAIKELVECGLLEKYHRFDDEHMQTSNMYIVSDLKKRKVLFNEIKTEINKGHYS